MPPLLSVDHLCICYETPLGERTVLDNASLSLSDHEHIGLFAPNGSGKTSFLRCLTGLLRAKKGRIFFHGQEVRKDSDFAFLRRSVGFCVQNAQDQIFFPTVLEDVEFGPLNLNLSPKEARKRALESLERLHILFLQDRNTRELSGGELRLVALAGILAMRPEALLLDEPTTGLDHEASGRVLSILKELKEPRITVSHDLSFLSRISDSFYTISERNFVKIEAPISHTHEHVHLFGNVVHVHGDEF